MYNMSTVDWQAANFEFAKVYLARFYVTTDTVEVVENEL